MKKIVTLALICAIACGYTASAQGILKSLGDRATKTVTKKTGDKVDAAVGKAFDKLFGKPETTNNTTSDANVYNNGIVGSYVQSATTSYAAELMKEDLNDGWDITSGLSYDIDTKSTLKFTSYGDAIKAMPEIPEASKVATAEGREKFSKKVAEYKIAVDALCDEYASKMAEYTRLSVNGTSGKSTKSTPSAGANVATSQISVSEISARCAAKGINMATATEEQMSDVMAEILAEKYGMTPAEAKAIMAQYKEVEESKSRLDQIQDTLSNLYQMRVDMALNDATAALTNIQSALLGGKTSKGSQATTMEGALRSLRREIIQNWRKSSECKKIDAMEKELSAKLESWMQKNKKGYNDSMPDFWVEGRKQQNEIIDKWNAVQLEKWIAKIKQYLKMDAVDAETIARMDEELESMNATEKAKAAWGGAKVQSVNLNGVIMDYALAPAAVLSMPFVSRASEESMF